MENLPRLLIVDDERPQLQALCLLLGQSGYAVVGCGTPQEALQRLQAEPFDLMLSDLKMPGIDGIELMRRALSIDADLMPVLMTGHGSIDTAVAAMKVGAFDYLLKPFRLSAVAPVLQRALEMRNLRVQNRLLQEQLASHARRLEAANAELDAFAGRVAHDLRAPVHIMSGFAEFLAERSALALDDQDSNYLQRIVAAGERADRMIHDLLAFARLGEQKPTLVPVALDEVMAQARSDAQAMLTEPAGRTHWELDPLPAVLGDASLLRQVFVNLLSNALKFSAGREQIRIQVQARAVDDEQEISIRDNGVGFDPAFADRLFSPFQRLHRQEDFEGTGMGLANVKRIVERHGGSVCALSRPGGGARFVLRLPAVVGRGAGQSG